MAISNTDAYAGPFTPNGVTTVFPYLFASLASNEVKVVRVSATGLQTLLTGYTATFGTAGGAVTFAIAPIAGDPIYVISDPSFAQQIVFGNQSPFLPEVVTAALDRAAVRDISLRDKLARSAFAPIGATLAGRVPVWDANGNPTVVLSTSLGAKGDTGGNVMSIGLFTDGSTLTIPAGADLVQTSGYGTRGIGHARYVYDTAVNPAYVTANPRAAFVSANGRGFRIADSRISPMQMGAAGDGVTDDRAALVAVDAALPAGAPFVLGGGSYLIATTLAIARSLVSEGGKFVIPNGVTLTLSGDVVPTMRQLFQCTGTGAVVFAPALAVGRPEWWGAVTNDSSVENVPYLNACLTACGIMELGFRDYFIRQTWFVTQSRRKIRGAGNSYDGIGGTRIVLTGSNVATSSIVQFGPLVFPSTQAQCTYKIECDDVAFVRDVAAAAVVPPGSGDVFDAVKGVVVAGVIEGRFRRLKSIGSPVGFQAIATVETDFDDWGYNRTDAGSSPVNDFAVGFLAGGLAAYLGFVGGNASLRIRRGTVVSNRPTGAYSGYQCLALLKGYISDTWFEGGGESAALPYGIVLDGNGVAAATAHQDVSLHHVVIDGATNRGIYCTGLNGSSAVNISDPYISTTSGVGIELNNCTGMVTVVGGQVLGLGTATGFKATNSNGWTVGEGVMFRDCYSPAVLSTVAAFAFRGSIWNPLTVGSGPAVSVTGSARGSIAPIVKGGTAKFTLGISMDVTSNNTEVNLTGIDQGCFTTVSAANKLFYNGATVAASPFGTTNIRSGVTT